MKLTAEEAAGLAGAAGPGVRRAMEILVALGRVFGAPDLVPVESVQVSGVSYRNIGQPGLEFLLDWAASGARARVPAFMNPGGLDRELWRALAVPDEFAARQFEVIGALERLGIEPLLSCTPYHAAPPPAAGAHLAWAESSAVSYANSVLGARTNREGGPSALAAALAGRTPRFGLHTDAGRLAGLRVRVRLPGAIGPADFGALGYLAGQAAGERVVFFEGLAVPAGEPARTVALKSLGAALAASGAVGLYHVAGVTPEALDPDRPPLARDAAHLAIDDLAPAHAALGARTAGPVDLVAVGCPHLSLAEVAELAGHLAGRRLTARLWLMTSDCVRREARARGLAAGLAASGALLVADTCVVVAPLAEMGVRRVATDSAKAAIYIPSHHGIPVAYGERARCLEAAETGRWSG